MEKIKAGVYFNIYTFIYTVSVEEAYNSEPH